MPSGSKKLILVVDDVRADSYVVARTLRHAGFHVFECPTLKCARENLNTVPDAIVLDINLPDGSGLEFSSELKRDGRTQHIPIIITSHFHDLSADHTRMIDSRAERYLAKPLESKKLLETLNDLLGTSNALPHAVPSHKTD